MMKNYFDWRASYPLTGQSTLVFLVYAETEFAKSWYATIKSVGNGSDLKKLINTWGIEFDNKKSVADPKFALAAVGKLKVTLKILIDPWIQITKED